MWQENKEYDVGDIVVLNPMFSHDKMTHDRKYRVISKIYAPAVQGKYLVRVENMDGEELIFSHTEGISVDWFVPSKKSNKDKVKAREVAHAESIQSRR
jgi:hypothetical protein